jgi:hypothetical protein
MISKFMKDNPIPGVAPNTFEGVQTYKKAMGLPTNEQAYIIDLDGTKLQKREFPPLPLTSGGNSQSLVDSKLQLKTTTADYIKKDSTEEQIITSENNSNNQAESSCPPPLSLLQTGSFNPGSGMVPDFR